MHAENNESNDKFRRLFDAITSGVAIYTSTDGVQFRFAYLNSAGEKISHVVFQDIAGREVREVFPGVAEMGLYDVFRRVWASGKAESLPVAFYADQRISRYYENSVYRISETEIAAVYNDITAQKKALQELPQREQQLRVLFDTSQAGILMVSPQGIITFANQRMAAMFGCTLDELIGSGYSEHLHPDQHSAGDERMRRLIAGEIDHVHNERHYIRKDGSDFWGHLSGRRYEDEQGRLISLVGVIADITEMKRTEEKLKQREQQFASLADNLPDVVARFDRAHRHLYVNRQIETVTGLSVNDYLGKTNRELGMPPELLEQWEKALSSVFDSGEIVKIRFAFPAADGIRHCESRLVPERGEDGTVETVLGIVRDITEAVQAEQLLIESEQRYRRLVEQSPAWIWRSDVELKNLYSNNYIEKMLGYSIEEYQQMDIRTLVHHDDQELFLKTAEEAVSSGRDWNGIVLRWLARDGSWRFVESSGGPIFDEKGFVSGLQGIDTDITERRLLQQEQEKNQRLESLGLLAGGIAHDFNNILTGIVGNISLARMMIDSDHRAAERLEQCEKAAKRASELTQQLLTFARGGEPVKKAIDIFRLVNESVSFTLRGSSVKGLLELPDGLWNIEADEGQINQALNNLLINAVQAMPEGGTVTVRGENCVSDIGAQPSGRHVRLTVKDTGIGIAPDQLARVFDPYFTTKKSGTGLGLASVYSIVTRHGGTVTVSSQLGVGSQFVICLPAAADLPAPETDNCEIGSAGRISGRRVLVMDDEELIRDVVFMMLSELGCLPDQCSDGSAAVELYRAALEQGRPYDAVILDLTVPGGMGGLEAARQIRMLNGNARLLVSSGYCNDAVAAELNRHGFSGAVMKPYTLKTLSDELGRILSESYP